MGGKEKERNGEVEGRGRKGGKRKGKGGEGKGDGKEEGRKGRLLTVMKISYFRPWT